MTARPGGTTITLEGRLAGPEVDELRACWRALAARADPASIGVALDAVTFIDPAGKALLRAMHAEGATFAASGCMTRAIVEEIGAAPATPRGRADTGRGSC